MPNIVGDGKIIYPAHFDRPARKKMTWFKQLEKNTQFDQGIDEEIDSLSMMKAYSTTAANLLTIVNSIMFLSYPSS